jgi:hypothetical protein
MLTKATLVACLLAGCSASTAIPRPDPPPSLMQPCAGPVRLPARDLSGAETETLWGRDRAALLSCASRQRGLADWINATGATGEKKE